MVMLEENGRPGVSFFYPIGSGPFFGSRIRAIPWEVYRKFVVPFAGLSGVLFLVGLALLNDAWYSDTSFKLFAGSLLVYGCVRLFLLRAKMPMDAKRVSVKRAPIVSGIDFCGFFLSLALMEIIFIQHAPRHSADALGAVAIIFLLWALIPICNVLLVSIRSKTGPT